jgi:MobA/MobL family
VAIYHWDCSIIKRSSGSSSVGSAAYRSSEKILDEKTGITHDFTKKKGVLHTEIITPDNVPDWAKNRHQLWNAVEVAEKRKDSQLAREIMVALPNELSETQRLELVRNYITDQFTTKGIIADLAIHAPNRKGDNRNYHAHILLTMRKITAEGFGNKERAWNAKANIYQWREQWQHHTNRMLREAGLDCQIDGRSHAKKGLDKEPLLHLGVHATALERKGIQTELGNENRAIESRNKLRGKLRYQLDEINKEINNLLPEKNAQTLFSTSEKDDNKHTVLIEEQEINKHNQQQVIAPINKTQLSDKNNPNAEKNTSVDTQQTKADLLLNQPRKQQEITEYLSLEERRKSLEKTAIVFNAQQEELKLQIENTADEKTQDRLRLKAELDDSKFTKTYSLTLANILIEEDHKKNIIEITRLKHKARKAEQSYKKQADEWSMFAIRDNDYEPLDQKSALKIEKIKAREQKAWARFEAKALNNDWSSDKIARETQRLIEELDIALKNEFGLDLDYGR